MTSPDVVAWPFAGPTLLTLQPSPVAMKNWRPRLPRWRACSWGKRGRYPFLLADAQASPNLAALDLWPPKFIKNHLQEFVPIALAAIKYKALW